MAENSAQGGAFVIGCMVPGAAALALGVGVYTLVTNHIDEALFAVGALGVAALVATVIWLAVWLGGVAINSWHDVTLKKAQQQIAIAAANRAHLDNRIVAQRAHLVEVTPDRQFVPMQELDSRAAYVLIGERIASLEQKFPNSLTYSPKYTHNPAMIAEQPAAALPEFKAPDFWTLYHAGKLPDHGFLMGFDPTTGAPITADWRQLYSALVGGSSGSGKSTLIRNILAQSALQGGRFVVLDKHFGAGDDSLGASLAPMRPLMLTDIAASDKQMLDALAYVRAVAEARLSGRDKDRTPIVLVTDETTGLLMRSNVASALVDVLGLITQESRKACVYAFAIGQQWNSKVLDTTVRNSFVSALSCRSRRDVARVMSGSNEFGQIVEALPQFHAAWMRPDGEIVTLSVPNCTDHHIELVAQALTPGKAPVYAPPEVAPLPQSLPLSLPDDDSGADWEGAAEVIGEVALTIDSTRAARVRQLIKSGASNAEILRNVWGLEKLSGRAYVTAAKELQEIIRALL